MSPDCSVRDGSRPQLNCSLFSHVHFINEPPAGSSANVYAEGKIRNGVPVVDIRACNSLEPGDELFMVYGDGIRRTYSIGFPCHPSGLLTGENTSGTRRFCSFLFLSLGVGLLMRYLLGKSSKV